MPIIEKAVFERAVDNVVTWGDTDVFPFPVDNHVMHDMRDQMVQVLQEISTDFDNTLTTQPLHNHSALAPVGYSGFRWATQLDPMWNAYLLALALSVAPDIESRRLDEASHRVFSYRFRQNTGDRIFADDGWKRFQDKTREYAESHEYVVAVDIADFYSRIYHHRLENSLRRVDPPGTKTRQVRMMLSSISNKTSYGLPVGGPAARILSELVLDSVDHLLTTEGIEPFCRFADDYRFFVPDIQAAYRAIGFLSEKLLRNEGLSLQKSKTRIMTSAEYISTLDPPNPPPGSAAQFLGLHIHFDPYSPTADQDYEVLREQIETFDIVGLLREELNKGRIHAAVTRRLIKAIQFMDPLPREQAVLSLLDNIETLAPVVPQAMLAIRDAIDRDPSIAPIAHQHIRRLIGSNHYVTRVEVNLAYMVRVLAAQHSTENEQILGRMYGSPHGFRESPSPTIQRDIMLAMARWRVGYWLSDKKNYIGNAHPWVKRAFIIGSFALGDEGQHWRQANKASFTKYELLLRDWAASKASQQGWQVPV